MTNISRQYFSRARIYIVLLGLLFGRYLYAQQALPSSSPAPATSVNSSDGSSSNASSVQLSVAGPLPDAPDPQSASSSPDQTKEQPKEQTKRILGIIPNFRAVSSDVHLPPQTVKEKFVTATQDSFDYSAIAIPVALAYYDYLRNSTPEFGTGGAGYGRYLWHVALDQTSENYMVEFFVPVVTREDTRFYTLGHGGFMKRAGYALSRVVVTRTDAGNPTFNFSEVVGAGMAAGLSNAYYPASQRSFSNTASNWGVNVAIDAMAFVVKELWPDVNHRMSRAKKSASPPPAPSAATP
jgi:hypothetical protein